jgi:hypothetical protein
MKLLAAFTALLIGTGCIRDIKITPPEPPQPDSAEIAIAVIDAMFLVLFAAPGLAPRKPEGFHYVPGGSD